MCGFFLAQEGTKAKTVRAKSCYAAQKEAAQLSRDERQLQA